MAGDAMARIAKALDHVHAIRDLSFVGNLDDAGDMDFDDVAILVEVLPEFETAS